MTSPHELSREWSDEPDASDDDPTEVLIALAARETANRHNSCLTAAARGAAIP